MPFAPFAAFVLGVCALQYVPELPGAGLLIAGSSVGIALALFAVRSAAARTAVVAACLAALVLGLCYAGWRAQWRLADALPFEAEGRDVVVTGVVDSLPVITERGVRFEFAVERHAAGDTIPERLLLGWYVPGAAPDAGERWTFTVRLRRPHGALNPGGFDFEAWLLERNLRATGYVRPAPPPVREAAMVWTPQTAIERARSALRDRLRAHLADMRYGGVLLALVLGDQRAISDADWTLFNRTGIAHLVSISGLHITMIAALVGGLVGAAWRRVPWLLHRRPAQTAAIVAGVLAAFLYALLAGWGVPAQRTVLMLAAVAIVWMARRRATPAATLAFAAFVVCVFDPWAVNAAGFWLSFGAVAAIMWVVQGRPRRGRTMVTAVATAAHVQLAVTLALVPATVLLFQQVSLISPLANAIAIPLVSWVVTPLALLGAVIAALPAPMDALAGPLLNLADGVFTVVASLLASMAAPAWATVPIAAPPLAVVVLAGAGVAWLLAPPGWPARNLGLVAVLPLMVWPGERPAADALWVTALDVGQGTAVVIETREHAWLYDAGPRFSQDSDAGERIVLPFLRGRGLAALDGFVVSHADLDHSGGAASVLRGIAVERVLTSTEITDELAAARAERCIAGQRIASGPLRLRVLHPTPADYARRLSSNAMSCVIRVQFGAISLLLTGDLPAREEAQLAAREPELASRWLMVPHHGSRSSSSAPLLDAVRPAIAAVQAGYRNRYGHPDTTVVARYSGRGIELLRTDHSGALQWRFAGGSVETLQWRAIAVRYWHNRPGAGRASLPDADDEVAGEGEPREPLFGMP